MVRPNLLGENVGMAGVPGDFGDHAYVDEMQAATADGPEPRSNGQKVYVKGISYVTGQDEPFEIANAIVTFEANWTVADVRLTHGEYDGWDCPRFS